MYVLVVYVLMCYVLAFMYLCVRSVAYVLLRMFAAYVLLPLRVCILILIDVIE